MKLSEIFSDWERIRLEMIEGVSSLTQDQLDWIPEGGKSSIADLLRHISEAELWWFGQVVLEKARYRDLTPKMAPEITSIVNELQESHKFVLEALEINTVDDWNKKKYSPRPEEVLSLKDIAWHTIEHEMRHRGQIFMLMRLQGIKPPNV
ncbi:MAG: DinB family protein [candidate division Zixibacteria bacterium]|nr:DinB family protein [candidate division Zixibacteria bacterium]